MVLSSLSITVTSKECVVVGDMSLVNLMFWWMLLNVDMNSIWFAMPVSQILKKLSSM